MVNDALVVALFFNILLLVLCAALLMSYQDDKRHIKHLNQVITRLREAGPAYFYNHRSAYASLMLTLRDFQKLKQYSQELERAVMHLVTILRYDEASRNAEKDLLIDVKNINDLINVYKSPIFTKIWSEYRAVSTSIEDVVARERRMREAYKSTLKHEQETNNNAGREACEYK